MFLDKPVAGIPSSVITTHAEPSAGMFILLYFYFLTILMLKSLTLKFEGDFVPLNRPVCHSEKKRGLS